MEPREDAAAQPTRVLGGSVPITGTDPPRALAAISQPRRVADMPRIPEQIRHAIGSGRLRSSPRVSTGRSRRRSSPRIGFTRTAIARRTAQGRLHRLRDGVYAVGHPRRLARGAPLGGRAVRRRRTLSSATDGRCRLGRPRARSAAHSTSPSCRESGADRVPGCASTARGSRPPTSPSATACGSRPSPARSSTSATSFAQSRCAERSSALSSCGSSTSRRSTVRSSAPADAEAPRSCAGSFAPTTRAGRRRAPASSCGCSTSCATTHCRSRR